MTIESARRPGDPARLVASSEKIRDELGWNPRYPDLETIIRTAWEWHRTLPRDIKIDLEFQVSKPESQMIVRVQNTKTIITQINLHELCKQR